MRRTEIDFVPSGASGLPERTAHKTMASNDSPGPALDYHTFGSASASSPRGSASRVVAFRSTLGSAAARTSPAGLSDRNPCAIAHRITSPMRCLVRRASSIEAQTGCSTASRPPAVMASTYRPPCGPAQSAPWSSARD